MTEPKCSAYSVSKTVSEDYELSDLDRARLHNHLRCIREGSDLWRFNSPDAGWELMTGGGGGWINLEETGLASRLLQKLSFKSCRLTAILGNPHSLSNLNEIADRDERLGGSSYHDSIEHRFSSSRFSGCTCSAAGAAHVHLKRISFDQTQTDAERGGGAGQRLPPFSSDARVAEEPDVASPCFSDKADARLSPAFYLVSQRPGAVFLLLSFDAVSKFRL